MVAIDGERGDAEGDASEAAAGVVGAPNAKAPGAAGFATLGAGDPKETGAPKPNPALVAGAAAGAPKLKAGAALGFASVPLVVGVPKENDAGPALEMGSAGLVGVAVPNAPDEPRPNPPKEGGAAAAVAVAGAGAGVAPKAKLKPEPEPELELDPNAGTAAAVLVAGAVEAPAAAAARPKLNPMLAGAEGAPVTV